MSAIDSKLNVDAATAAAMVAHVAELCEGKRVLYLSKPSTEVLHLIVAAGATEITIACESPVEARTELRRASPSGTQFLALQNALDGADEGAF